MANLWSPMVSLCIGSVYLSCANSFTLIQWLWEETDDQQVVSSNPCTAYNMDHFSHLFVAKIVLLYEKTENKRKRHYQAIQTTNVPNHGFTNYGENRYLKQVPEAFLSRHLKVKILHKLLFGSKTCFQKSQKVCNGISSSIYLIQSTFAKRSKNGTDYDIYVTVTFSRALAQWS